MNPILGIAAIFIIGLSIFFSNRPIPTKPSLKPTPNPTATITPTMRLSATTAPTQILERQSNPTQGTAGWTYPGSIQDGNSYTTSDSTDTVTNWYREKIQSSGMKTTTVVMNSVNGNIDNQLVGGNENTQVKIVITKKSTESITHIAITQ